MASLQDVFSYKQATPAPAVQGAAVLPQRTLGNLQTAADVQRKFDPNVPMPAPAQPAPVAAPAQAIAQQGVAANMQPQPEGFVR